MKYTNTLASYAERKQAKNALPKALRQHLEQQARLQALIATIITVPTDSYQVVRYHAGELGIATTHASLIGHFKYLESTLVSTLQTLPEFADLHKISVTLLANR